MRHSSDLSTTPLITVTGDTQDQDSASGMQYPTSTRKVGLCYALKAFLGWADEGEDQCARRRLLRVVFFAVMGAMQLFLFMAVIIKVYVYGAADAPMEPAYDLPNQLSACPDLATVDLLWLGWTAIAGCLSLWSLYNRRKFGALHLGESSDPLLQSQDGHAQTNTDPVRAGGVQPRNADRENVSRDGVPASRPRVTTIVSLPAVMFLYYVTLSLWVTRIGHCRLVAPRVGVLSNIIMYAVTWAYLIWSCTMMTEYLWKRAADKKVQEDLAAKLVHADSEKF